MVKIIQETENMYFEDRWEEYMFSLEKKTEGKHYISVHKREPLEIWSRIIFYSQEN